MINQIITALITYLGFQILQTIFQFSTIFIVSYEIDNQTWYTQDYRKTAFIILQIWLFANFTLSFYQVGVLIRQYRGTLQQEDNSFKNHFISFLWGILCFPLSYLYYILGTFKILYYWDRCSCCVRLDHKPKRPHFLTHFSMIQFVIKNVTLFFLFLINSICVGWGTVRIIVIAIAGLSSLYDFFHILKQPWIKPINLNQPLNQNQIGAINQAGSVNQTGVVNQAGVSNQPDIAYQTDPINHSGLNNHTDIVYQTGTINQVDIAYLTQTPIESNNKINP